MEQLTEVKQSKLKKMSSDRIKKHLVKVGYDEDELEQMSRSELMTNLANEWLKEIKVENISSSSSSGEEEGAVGGAKAEIKVTSPMSMEVFLQWMMMEKQKEEKREEERRKEKEEQREKEEERRREKEEKERERRESKEEKERERREREEIEKRQRDADLELRRSELEVQQAQFKQQLDEIRKNREDADQKIMEQMIEIQKAKKDETERQIREKEERILEEERKEQERREELIRMERIRQEDLALMEKDRQDRINAERIQLKLKEDQIEAERRRREMENTLISQIKKIGDAMKHVLPRMPQDLMEIPLYFQTVENAFRSFAVEERHWVKLLLPLMTPKARTVLNRLAITERDNYQRVREHLLQEYKLTAREYRSRFLGAKKTVEETYTMFTARLKNLLNYYVQSRNIDKDFDLLFDLLVADRLKEELPPGPLQFVLAKEATDCLQSSVIADLADIHVNNRIGFGVPYKVTGGFGNLNQSTNAANQQQQRMTWVKKAPFSANEAAMNATSRSVMKVANDNRKEGETVRRCYNYNSTQHLSRWCNKPPRTENKQMSKINRISLVHDANKDDAAYEEQETEVKVVMKCGMSTSVILEKIDREDAEQRMVISPSMTKKKDELFKVCLQYVDVELRGEEGHGPLKVKVLADSGAEVPVVSKDLLKVMKSEFVGKVKLQCVAGEAIPADLVKLDVRMCGDENQDIVTPYVSLVCACIEKMGSNEKFLLHPDIIADLKKSSKENLKIPVRAVTRARSKNQEQAKKENESESVGEKSMKNVIDGEFEFNKGKGKTSSKDHEVTDACELNKLFETNEGDGENVKEIEYERQNEREKEVMKPVQMNTSDTDELEKQQRNDKTLSEWWRFADRFSEQP